jgi:hypothetical protein
MQPGELGLCCTHYAFGGLLREMQRAVSEDARRLVAIGVDAHRLWQPESTA